MSKDRVIIEVLKIMNSINTEPVAQAVAHILPRRSVLELSGYGSGGALLNTKLAKEARLFFDTPPFEAFVSNKQGRTNLLLIKDFITNKVLVSMGSVESSTTPDGNPATIFREITGIEAPNNGTVTKSRKVDVHALTENISYGFNNNITVYADILTEPNPSAEVLSASQVKLVEMYKAYGMTGQDIGTGLMAFPGEASIVEVRGLISNDPIELAFTIKIPGTENIIGSWALTALKPVKDPTNGFSTDFSDRSKPQEISFSAQLPEIKTVQPVESQLPPITELSKKVEAATGMKMAKSPNGKYDIFVGDKEEKYKLYPEKDGKFDTLTWNIKSEAVEFQNLTDDIVQKPADAEGNQVVWIQGFSATKDSKSGEIKWDIVAESYRKETGTVRENLPIFHDYKDKTLHGIMEQNHLNYMKVIENKFPPEKLFKEEIIEILTGNYEVAAEGTKEGFVLQTFFPSSTKGRLLYGYHIDKDWNGNGNNRVPVDALTGRYSPFQFSTKGNVCVITEDGWDMIKCPVYIREKEGIIRVFGVEDGITGSGKPIMQRYNELTPSSQILLVQYDDNPENRKKIQKRTIVSPAVSNRMGVYYANKHIGIDFRRFEVVDGEIRALNFLSKDFPAYAGNFFNIKGPLISLTNQEFLIESRVLQIDR